MTDANNDAITPTEKDASSTTPPDAHPAPFITPEDEEFEAAQAELAAYEAAKAAPAAAAPTPSAAEAAENEAVAGQGEEPSTEPAATAPEAGSDAAKIAGLTAALTASRSSNREAELAAARAQGEASSLRTRLEGPEGGTAAAPEPAPKTPQEQIETLQTDMLAIAQKVEDGDIGPVEAEEQRQVLDNKVHDVRETSRPPVDPGQPPLDATVESNMVRLEKDHPALTEFSKPEMSVIHQEALNFHAAKGTPIGAGALETIRLHNTMAAMATHKAAFMSPDPSPTSQPEKKNPAELSPEAIAREKALAKAGDHPPDLANVGQTAEGEKTDEQHLAAMQGLTEEQEIAYVDAMPANTYQRLMGTPKPITYGQEPPGA